MGEQEDHEQLHGSLSSFSDFINSWHGTKDYCSTFTHPGSEKKVSLSKTVCPVHVLTRANGHYLKGLSARTCRGC